MSENKKFLLHSTASDSKPQKSSKDIVAGRLESLVLEQVTEAVIVYDLNGHVIFANNASRSLLGKIPEGDLPLFTYPDKKKISLSIPLAGGVRREISANYLHENGEEIPMFVNKGPLLNSANEIVGCVIVLVDIRERVKMRKTLEATEEQFRQAQKMESIGILAGGVAHDFNNILATVTLLTDFVLGDLGEGHSQFDTVKQICGAHERATALTRQLLAFSRKQHIEPKSLNISGAVAEIQKMLVRLVGEDVELSTDLATEPFLIWCDQGHFEQVIMNLVANARDAIERQGKILIRTWCDENQVYCSVTDSGCGMDEKIKERIFEPFFTTKPIGKGTGLGLSTVFGIIQQHNGKIQVDSEINKGSTFTISFKRWQGVVETAPKVFRRVDTKKEPLKILLIEDDLYLRKVSAAVLRSSGHEVVEAEEGEHALSLLSAISWPLDLIVTDVVMPKMGGPEAASQIRKIHPEIRVLFLSGYTEDVLMKYEIDRQTVSFLEKPYTRNKFLEAIETAIAK